MDPATSLIAARVRVRGLLAGLAQLELRVSDGQIRQMIVGMTELTRDLDARGISASLERTRGLLCTLIDGLRALAGQSLVASPELFNRFAHALALVDQMLMHCQRGNGETQEVLETDVALRAWLAWVMERGADVA